MSSPRSQVHCRAVDRIVSAQAYERGESRPAYPVYRAVRGARGGAVRGADDARLGADPRGYDLGEIGALQVGVVPCNDAYRPGAVRHESGRGIAVRLESHGKADPVRYPGAVHPVPHIVARQAEGGAVAVGSHLGVRLDRTAGVEALRSEEELLVPVHREQAVLRGVARPDEIPEPVERPSCGDPPQHGIVRGPGVDRVGEGAGQHHEACGCAAPCGRVGVQDGPQGIGVQDPHVVDTAVPQRRRDLLHVVLLIQRPGSDGDLHIAVVRRVAPVIVDVQTVDRPVGPVVGDGHVVDLGPLYGDGVVHGVTVQGCACGVVRVVGRVHHGLSCDENRDDQQGHGHQREIGAPPGHSPHPPSISIRRPRRGIERAMGLLK